MAELMPVWLTAWALRRGLVLAVACSAELDGPSGLRSASGRRFEGVPGFNQPCKCSSNLGRMLARAEIGAFLERTQLVELSVKPIDSLDLVRRQGCRD